MRDVAIAYAPFIGPLLAAAILAVAGLIIPYLPGPVRAALQAKRTEAESVTHKVDTDLIKDAALTAATNAAVAYGTGQISKEAALADGVAYIRRTVGEVSAKVGITDPTLAAMVASRLEKAVAEVAKR